jgi:hypothetical protein
LIIKGDSKPFLAMLVIDENDWVTKRVCAEDNKSWLVNRTDFKPLRPDVFPAMNSSRPHKEHAQDQNTDA